LRFAFWIHALPAQAVALADSRRHPFSAFHGEADFDGHLPVVYLPFVDTSAGFDHLEPAQVLDGFMRALNSLLNRVLDRGGGSAGEFDEFIDVVFHVRFFEFSHIGRLEISG
jgi:hypothetical protein